MKPRRCSGNPDGGVGASIGMLVITVDGKRACAACRYDLSGHGERGLCPECGRRFSSKISLLPRAGRAERSRSLRGWPGLAALLKGVAISLMVLGSTTVVGYFAWRILAWFDRLTQMGGS